MEWHFQLDSDESAEAVPRVLILGQDQATGKRQMRIDVDLVGGTPGSVYFVEVRLLWLAMNIVDKLLPAQEIIEGGTATWEIENMSIPDVIRPLVVVRPATEG